MNPSQLHAVIISAVYPPEPLVSARMGKDLASHLAGKGMHVTVLCPQPSRPMHTDYTQYRNPGAPLMSREEGVDIVRLPSFAAPQSKMFARLRESYSFGSMACRYLVEQEIRPDILYVNSWPLLAQAWIALHARRRRIPLVLQIMDIYPESLLSRRPAAFARFAGPPLRLLDRWIARQATLISVISESMRRTYVADRRIDGNKVAIIDLWQDESLFEHLPPRLEACEHYQVPAEKFTFLYLGNIGPVAGVDFLIRAFHKANLGSAQLVIAGDGSAKASCKELVKQLGAANVLFIAEPDATRVPLLQSMAHIFLLPLKRGVGTSSIPSKLPAYLFSAKPILATIDADSDSAEIIRQAGCGWVGEPENEEWLSARMREAAALPLNELEQRGRQGRVFGLERFTRAKGAERLASLVLAAGGCEQVKEAESGATIMPMERSQVMPVVDIHMESFQGFFLSFLGKKFLQVYYEGVLRSADGIAFVAMREDTIVGFVTGFVNPRGFYRTLLRRDLVRFGLAALPAALSRPGIVFQLLRALRKPSNSPADDSGELSSIAVAPGEQGRGTGKALITAFLREAGRREASSVYLTTDSNDNMKSNEFYRKRGFLIVRTFVTPEKRHMLEYRYEFKNVPREADNEANTE